MKKKLLSMILATVMVASLVGCGAKEEAAAPAATTEAPAAEAEAEAPAAEAEAEAPAADGLIKVGIINNDPNESGYRTANDKSMKEVHPGRRRLSSSLRSRRFWLGWRSSGCS